MDVIWIGGSIKKTLAVSEIVGKVRALNWACIFQPFLHFGMIIQAPFDTRKTRLKKILAVSEIVCKVRALNWACIFQPFWHFGMIIQVPFDTRMKLEYSKI
jgi:hypothetical protein